MLVSSLTQPGALHQCVSNTTTSVPSLEHKHSMPRETGAAPGFLCLNLLILQCLAKRTEKYF